MRITKRQPRETLDPGHVDAGEKVIIDDDAASEGASGCSAGASSVFSAGEGGSSSSSNILVSKLFLKPVWITQIGKGAIMY